MKCGKLLTLFGGPIASCRWCDV